MKIFGMLSNLKKMNCQFIHYYFSVWLFMLLVAMSLDAGAENKSRIQKKAEKAATIFAEKVSSATTFKTRFDTVIVDKKIKTVTVKMNEGFANVPFRIQNTEEFYGDLKTLMGRHFRKYTFSIETMGQEISSLIPNFYRSDKYPADVKRMPVNKESSPVLVKNISKNVSFPAGLSNRHITLWHSHGWYYENTLDRWEWQRARLFNTVEDLFTMSIVVPYLAPMLENAGANVFIPRERDTQLNEVIVDADGSSSKSEYIESGNWEAGAGKGFGLKVPFYFDGENPFTMGQTRRIKADAMGSGKVVYIPEIPETGMYSVSVSYGSSGNNVPDAIYIVNHSGGKTAFRVNQQMGAGTWIYLGTFQFEKGKNQAIGSVELSNQSAIKGGYISADAVKFGGGMGNIARGKNEQLEQLRILRNEKGFETDSLSWIPFISQRPRYQEGARYYLQYAGMPDSTVYSVNRKNTDYSFRGSNASLYAIRESGKEDYKDDYMSRGYWVNYLLGNAANAKNAEHIPGLNIPVDMSLAFHTDAGITPDSSIIGTLAIYNTTFGPDTFPNGQSKWASRDLSDIIQTQVTDDLRKLYEPQWTRRGIWNKQYSEATRPKVPAMLSEVLSHQNFADMALGSDPRFKFDMSRAFYKGILRFLSSQYDFTYVVQPLPVSHFQMSLSEKGVRLTWCPVADPLEPTATPSSYRIYTRIEKGGFDNGVEVTDTTYLMNDLKPGVLYSFKITAINSGGESFPSEVLACCIPANGKKPVLIVNAFDRISAPAMFDNGKEAGFNTMEDEGVPYLSNVGFIGDQYDFDRSSPWKDDDSSGFGSSHADQETHVTPGNSFDYPAVHGSAIRNNGGGFISMSDEAFETGNWEEDQFSMLDIIFGEEKTTRRIYGNSKPDFTLFTPAMRSAIQKYISASDAKVIISGAYVGTDLELCSDTMAAKFAADVLYFRQMTNHASKSGEIIPVNSMANEFSSDFHFNQQFHPDIYKVESPDAIEPVGKEAKVLFRYKGDNKSAAVICDGKYQTVVLGFPFETITTENERTELMGQLMKHFGLK